MKPHLATLFPVPSIAGDACSPSRHCPPPAPRASRHSLRRRGPAWLRRWRSGGVDHRLGHLAATQCSYLTPNGGGDVAAEEAATAYTETTTSMLWLKSVDVLSRESPGAIVAFGDSITDGTCSTLDAHDRWEDWLSVRLDLASDDGNARRWRKWRGRDADLPAVVNEGIGGNTVTRAGLQPPPDSIPGVERLDRDVFSHTNVKKVILFMGTNDIRREASAAQVIAGIGGHHQAHQGARHEDLRRHHHPAPQRRTLGDEHGMEPGQDGDPQRGEPGTTKRRSTGCWIKPPPHPRRHPSEPAGLPMGKDSSWTCSTRDDAEW